MLIFSISIKEFAFQVSFKKFSGRFLKLQKSRKKFNLLLRVEKNESGSALLLVLFLILILSCLASGLIYLVLNDHQMTEYNYRHQQSIYLAEAALAEAVAEINKDPLITADRLAEISENFADRGFYYISEAEKLFDQPDSEPYFLLKAVGESGPAVERLSLQYIVD